MKPGTVQWKEARTLQQIGKGSKSGFEISCRKEGKDGEPGSTGEDGWMDGWMDG